MNIVFMGTPDFAVTSLERIIKDGHNVLAVYSQQDKPVGRKQVLTPPPVKACALHNNIPVFQPQSFRDAEDIEKIKSFNADVIIVIAYGKILPIDVLNAAKYGCINVHASLLPKYRGAAPIQWAVLNGDKQTGVCVMQMDEGIDTGDILYSQKTDIDDNETSQELFERLSVLGADALSTVLNNIEYYLNNRVKQPDGDFGYAKKITKSLAPIDWTDSAAVIHNQVRGLQTWPCALTTYNGRNLKIHKTVLSAKKGINCGEVVDNKDVITVCCGDGNCIDILELQLDGKKRMDSKAFMLGNNVSVTTKFGG